MSPSRRKTSTNGLLAPEPEDSVVGQVGRTRLGETIPRLRVKPERSGDDVIDEDVILVWGDEKRVITGADILGRLMRGIVQT